MKQPEASVLITKFYEITDKFKTGLPDYKYTNLDGSERILKRVTGYAIINYITEALDFIKNISPSLENEVKEEVQIRLNNLYVEGTFDISKQNFQFLLGIDFSNTVFSNSADFRKVKFDKSSDFSYAIFESWVSFEEAEFKLATKFYNTEFRHEAHFNKAKFNGETDCTYAKFSNIAVFKDAEFYNTTLFTRAIFEIPPSFHGAELYPETSFRNANFKSTIYTSDLLAYRTLQHIMKNINNRLDEGLFFACEQRTLRNLDEYEFLQKWYKSITAWGLLLFPVLISIFYDWISKYGQSIWRPIVWILGTLAVFSFIFLYPNGVEVNKEYIIQWIRELPPNLGLALQNIFKPFMFDKDLPFRATNSWITLASIIQSLLTIAFITLWLFAVRRRFQKGE